MLIIIDAGGVLHPDSDLGGANQTRLHNLTKWTPAQLDAIQNHEQLNQGLIPLNSVFEKIISDTPTQQLSIEQLREAYLAGIRFYPGAADMLRHLIACGHKLVLLTNNSDEGVDHTKALLEQEALSMITVYGSAEIKINKPAPDAFQYVCREEQINPKDCLFIDDRRANLDVAEQMGMATIEFRRPLDENDAVISIATCLQTLVETKIIYCPGFVYQNELPSQRGMYPSFLGLQGDKHIRINPRQQNSAIIDETNPDGNLRKHCLYETLLARLICEDGRSFWQKSYNKINLCFLTDFSIKARNIEKFSAYFAKIKSVLKKISHPFITHTDPIETLRLTVENLFSNPIDLAQVSQFYYELWLEPYGPDLLEPFVFLVDELSQQLPSTSCEHNLRILAAGNLAHSAASRKLAYYIAQPFASCGLPQLRGREKREGSISHSNTIGILPDNDPLTDSLKTLTHFAAKQAFQPCRNHQIAQELQEIGGPVIGGTSGTLGRNILMLAPLVAANLLSQDELLQYCMGFWADLVYRGHHSYEEIALVFSQVVRPLKSWLDPLRMPKEFYEQLLTAEFLQSTIYQDFSEQHQSIFNEPMSDFGFSM